MRVGIVDDHPLFRLGLRQALSRNAGVSVRWDVDSGGEALRQVAIDPVDLVLVDLNLGDGIDGVVVTSMIAAHHPRVRVAVITGLPDDRMDAARQAGAVAFLPKYMSVDALVRQVEWLGSAGGTNGSRAANRPPAPEVAGLSHREAEVLAEVRAGRTNREIASELGISATTVNKHVHHILRKLNARNRAQAVAFLDTVSAGGHARMAGGGVRAAALTAP